MEARSGYQITENLYKTFCSKVTSVFHLFRKATKVFSCTLTPISNFYEHKKQQTNDSIFELFIVYLSTLLRVQTIMASNDSMIVKNYVEDAVVA